MSDSLYEKISVRRKELQEKGLLPLWYSSAGLQLFEERYEYDTTESVRGQFKRIARTAAGYLKGISLETEAEERFFDMLWKGWLSPSTPVLANMGTNRGLSVSCSGAYIQDSIDSFYSVRHETALLTKHGFGTSAYLGDIRPRGTPISVGGKASGVVPLFKGFVQDMRDVAQGTARRGAWAGYLPIDHGDFDELIDFIHSESDDANVGWIVTDAFIEKLNKGDTDSIRRYQKAMKIKMVTGKGYFLFIDKANRHRPECYKKHDLTIKNSNLCLVGDSIIIIKESEISNEIYIRLDEFVDKYQFGYYTNPLVKSYKDNKIVWSVITDAGKTADVEELYEIESPNGKIIRCTANHKIFTTNRGYVEAKNLVETDTVLEG